jgi:uncharacterized protein YdeI (YjbR/CyaY-like superfamily)
MSKPLPTDMPMRAFSSAADFDAFLEENHESTPGIYVKLAKKSSGIMSITAEEAVEVGLCYGWIDGWGRGIDDSWYFKRYTPRRAKSIWSQKNVATVARLTEAGRMKAAGPAAVEAAKKDGRWDRAYAGPATIKVPDDFAVALEGNDIASKFFNSLNRSDRYSVLWRIQTASPTARDGRIQTLLTMLAKREAPSQLGGVKDANNGRRKRDSVPKAETNPEKREKVTKRVRATAPKDEGSVMLNRRSKRVASIKKA